MTDYYTPEELDAMPVGTRLTEERYKAPATKQHTGRWTFLAPRTDGRSRKGYSSHEVTDYHNFPKPTKQPHTPPLQPDSTTDELAVIYSILSLLEPLTQRQGDRVLSYIMERREDGE